MHSAGSSLSKLQTPNLLFLVLDYLGVEQRSLLPFPAIRWSALHGHGAHSVVKCGWRAGKFLC